MKGFALEEKATTLIEIRDLKKTFPPRRISPPVVALNKINLDVKLGEFVSLRGQLIRLSLLITPENSMAQSSDFRFNLWCIYLATTT